MRPLSLVLILIFPLVGFAQQVEFGIKGGLNIGNIQLEDQGFTKSSRHDFHWGLYGSKMFNDQWGFLLETHYSKKGSYINDEKFVLHYLSFQPQAIYDFNGIFYAQAGMEYAILLDAEYPGVSGLKDQFNTGDFSLVVGAGMYLWKLRLDLRYIYGLSNIAKDQPDALPAQINNRTVQISLGYQLH